ncbi:transporter [Nocardioides cavernaquae]|uniref:Transporter n=2 Tax=Nocardioides cavernaquae TaxID=2321396 RepID=A0A3A5HIX3_9ACTN|nr:transporter [Nocardioides cavernaquae]
MACTAITVLVLGADRWSGSNVSGFYTLGIFVVEAAVFTTLLGGSFGQLMTRLRVVRLDGGRLGPLPALARSAMIALVIPPLVFKPDGRGLHDLVAGSRVVPLHAG